MFELSMFAPVQLILIAALNPVVAIVAFLMGRACDDWKKLLLAGFAAALAGAAAVWIAVYTGFLIAKGIGAETGVFVFSIFFGVLWSALGYALRQRSS
ncbi:MAG: hypothetical protein AAFQ44_00010 [Pseudomonadota bacterium]